MNRINAGVAFYDLEPNKPKDYRRKLLVDKIRNKLKADGMKLRDLANMLNKNSSEVSKWLSGKHNLSIDTLFDIEDQLKITLVNIDLAYKEVTNKSKSFSLPTDQVFSTSELINNYQDKIKSITKSY